MPSFVPPVESTMESRTEPNADDGLVAAEVVTAEESTAVPDPDSWRDEISARLNRFRSRRKIRPPRYPSLKLPFAPIEALPRVEVPPPSPPAHVYEPVSNHALALDMRQEPVEHHTEQYPAAEAAPRSVSEPVAHSGAKIIEFPRFAWGPPPPPPDQLAEPVGERPRILEVPEVAPPLPALGGITIEAPERVEDERRPGIDLPLQSASLSRRILAAMVDGMIIAVAASLFGFIFWKVTAIRPPRLQILGIAAGALSSFWVAYEYLLIVYAGSTPGLRAAGLELTRFDGSATSRSLRRWRVLGTCLSAVSLGMGYAWVFLDEDALCWHDRITHTYLAPQTPSKPGLPKT
jgi:hypothetical protein